MLRTLCVIGDGKTPFVWLRASERRLLADAFSLSPAPLDPGATHLATSDVQPTGEPSNLFDAAAVCGEFDELVPPAHVWEAIAAFIASTLQPARCARGDGESQGIEPTHRRTICRRPVSQRASEIRVWPHT
jgi:hypothetical protein